MIYAAEDTATTWPEAFMFVAFLACIAFFIWMLMR